MKPRRHPGRELWLASLLIVLITSAGAASNLLPNPGFEEGTATQPAGWRCDNPAAFWASHSYKGSHSLLVQGNGHDSFSWQAAPISLFPGRLYRLSFFGRRDADTSGGCVVSGIDGVNRDFTFTDQWQPYGFTFTVPQNTSQSWVRLGQWEVHGKLYFDDAALHSVQVAHSICPDGSRLGEGETIRNGVYRFSANYGWVGANFHRTLFLNRCGFNSDRWTFGPGSEVVYRHDLSASQTNASVRLNLNYYMSGALQVDASRDGIAWLPVGTFDAQRRAGTNALPASLFPATNIFVRFSSSSNANLQVNAYDFEARLSGAPSDDAGHTQFFEVLQEVPAVAVKFEGVRGENEEQVSRSVALSISNISSQVLNAQLTLTVDGKPQPDSTRITLNLPGGDPVRVIGTCQLATPGKHEIIATVVDSSGAVLFSGRAEVNLSLLSDPRAGYWAGGGDGLQLWWCEGAWKIGRTKQWPAPTSAIVPITVSAAKGESEPVQLVMHPSKEGVRLNAVQIGPFVDPHGTVAAVTTRMEQVEYVQVTHPTDGTCVVGWYPDPLPRLQLPLSITNGQNCPLWVVFQVSRDAVAGDYAGWIELDSTAGKLSVPVKLHIYDFALPQETHLRSALGLGAGEIERYHHLKTPQDRQSVYDKYLANFVEHRISPYTFFDHAPIEVRFVGEGTNKHAQVDFTKFDAAAARWLDQEKFNSFMLPLQGMGGGTFQSRSLGTLEGFTEGTPEHARLFKDYLSQVEQHLRERGWLDKAYAYWFDEPDQKDFEFVAAGMKRIQAASPGLKRMLTKQPAPLLEGNVDIWCALTPEWTPEKVHDRRAAGQEVWWYICCAPTAPYLTEFIDHPGSELRLWPWQSWQYDVQGILIWSTTYWTSSSAFPGNTPQDPWKDPMSYVSGYDYQAGHIGYWGNGDGRFIYPPREAITSGDPVLDGPVNSIRWENLRDGMEDYEYFWLLDQAITRAQARGAKAEVLTQARSLLKVPLEISTDTTHFTTDPRPLLIHRDRIAKMIEQLETAKKTN